MLNKSQILLFIALIFYSSGYSQNVSFVASATKNPKTGEPFIIQYKLEAPQQGKDFNYQATPNLNVLNTGTSSFTQTTIVNGRTSKSITYTWSLTVVTDKEGTYNIQPATVKVGGQIYKSNALTIEVGKGTGNKSNVISDNSVTPENNLETKLPDKDIFLNITTNKSEAYLGEAIYSSTSLYSRYNVNLSEYNASTYDNFWIQDLPMSSSIKADYTTINGKQYLTAVLEKKVIFPQKTGEIIIESADAVFQLYDNWGFPYGTKKVVSNKKIVNVKPLPAGKPADFSGAVGDFSLNLSTSAEEIDIDQSFTIEISINGTGNFGLFDDLKFDMPKSFEPLLPETENNISATYNGMQGSKTFKFSYLPRVPGEYNIKEISFSYFNPSTKKYYTLKTQPITIKVIGDSLANTAEGVVVKSDALEISDDIRYIKTQNLKLYPKNHFIFGSSIFWLAYLIPFLAFVFIIIFLRKKIKENANFELVKSKKADKVSIKRLKTANKKLNEQDYEGFYNETAKALWGYVSDKLFIPLSELTRQTVTDTLINYNVDEDLINNFVKTIDNCETAKYAPVSQKQLSSEVLSNASQIISTFEKKIHIFRKK